MRKLNWKWNHPAIVSVAFVLAFGLGFFLSQAAYAFGSVLVSTSPSGDAMIDAVSSSGPAAGAVVILAFVIRAWLADMKVSHQRTDERIEKLITAIAELTKDDNKLREEYIGLRADLRDQERRLSRIERRHGSGATRKADEST